MKPIIINLPFNYQDLIDSQKLIWNFSNGKFISSQIKFIIMGIVCLLIGIFGRDWIGLGIGAGFLFYIVLGCVGYYERKNRFLKKAKRNTILEGSNCTFKLNDDVFEYEDMEKLLRLNWSLFYSIKEYKGNILVFLKDEATVSFTFSKKELGEDMYQEVFAFLNEKINSQIS